MWRIPPVAFWLLLHLAALSAAPRAASAAGISAEFDSCGVDTSASPAKIDTVNFHPYKVPLLKSVFANRDLEFLWSNSYASPFNRPLDDPRLPSTDTDLDLLGLTICDTPATGAFEFPIPFIQLIYDYLRAPDLAFGRPPSVDSYSTNPADTMGFAAPYPTYGNLDRNHADTYLFAPKFSGDPLYQEGGIYYGDGGNPSVNPPHPMSPSAFLDADEDVSSHHPASLDTAGAYHGNSINIKGPRPSQVGVGGLSDWTGPRALAPLVFNHEFQHMINDRKPDARITEILSHAAEALTGDHPETPAFDVPYTWGLLRNDLNYQAYRSFSAYLTYNFRGVVTTFAGRSDDLIWRWARSNNRSLVAGLGQQLLAVNCAECTTRTYFHGLSATDRLNLLVHNWRVANYVNKPALADSQYGFPPEFGFAPNFDVGNWQNVDNGAADTVSIELQVRIDASHLTRDLSLSGTPTSILNPQNAHAMALSQFGSEYWVVRSDPSLWSANHDLVVRIMPEGQCALRLMMSAIAYTQQDLPGGQPDSLWKHPEWAQLAVEPRWVDLATGVNADPLEIVVPYFGATYKAALIVITTGSTSDAGSDSYVLPYRLNLALRTAPYMNPNPLQVTTFTSPHTAALPSWSPGGDEIAFVRTDATAGPHQIFRVSSAGGTPTPLFPQSVDQLYPDWSPRGDWVCFDQESSPGNCDIWAVHVASGQSRRLTTASEDEIAPVFSPNGQRLVYLRYLASGAVQIRRVNLDGSNDTLLVTRTNTYILPPRWAPNGPRVYFIAGGLPSGDSLYAVEALGPSRGLVTPIGPLAAGEFSFDPPRGSGRWVWESDWQPLSCGAPGTATYRRVSVRGAPTGGASETIFSRPFSTLSNPRWSWDGTRVAFSAIRPIPPTPMNVVVGQVTYNHAPSFVGLNDQTPTTGQAFQMDVSAADPDGESLTYEAPAVFLPPGATFDAGARRLTWPSPAPQGAEFFVVFRALDASGAVAHRVVRLYVQDPAGGGCPFLDTRTAAGWKEENSVLGRSLTGAYALDPYRLRFTPEIQDGRVSLRLRENEQEYTTLDVVRLLAVDHEPEVRAYALGDQVFLGTRVPAHRVTTSSGRDITALVSGSGGFFWGAPGETLIAQMTAPRASGTLGATGTQDGGGGGEGGMEGDPKETQVVWDEIGARSASLLNASAVDAAVLQSTGILVEVPDGSGGWRTLSHYYPRRYRDETVVDSMGLGPCRLVFLGRHRLHFVGRYLRAAAQAAPHVLDLLAASHSRLGDALSAVSQSAGATSVLAPGDTLTLEFAAPPVPAGLVREYLLHSTGVYSASAPLAHQESRDLETPLPARVALGQNQPNPFGRTTTIRFELPGESTVRLEIFDLQGRRVAVLAEGTWPAGYHAVDWDRRDPRGIASPPGIYFYQFSAGAFHERKKMVLVE